MNHCCDKINGKLFVISLPSSLAHVKNAEKIVHVWTHKLRGILRHRAFGHADVSKGEGLTRPWGASYVPQHARRYFLIESRDFFRER